MNLLLAAIVLFLIVETNAQWYNFPSQVVEGSRDMGRAYTDMREANWKNSDKGPGGRWAATVISNGRAAYHIIKDRDRVEIARDQEANRWGRNGGDPNRYRPRGLLSKY
uniref:Serum amyloid A n=1 Tax=Sparus aurata TaxID=8175 RepID=A0A671VFD0_SPAAU